MRRKSLFRTLDRYIGIPILLLAVLFKKKRNPLPSAGGSLNRIMVIKFAAIGDSILLIPMLRTLKKSLPSAEIVFLCSPINESIARKIPYVDKVIVSDVHSFLLNPVRILKFIFSLRKEKYDVIIDTEQWSRISAIICATMKFRYSVGFRTSGQYRHFMYDSAVNHSRTKHELETFLDLLQPIEIPVREDDYRPEYFLSEENKRTAETFWTENNLLKREVICLHQGCGDNGKAREWELENYVKLGKRLIEYDDNIIILITGSSSEIPKCRYISDGIGGNIINTAGRFTLDEVVAIVERVKLIVCSNTGMLHLASCVDTKTMGLHGPTNPVKWGAYSKNTVLIQSDKYCSPCLYLGHDYGCSAPSCMKHISVDDVFIHIRKALNPEQFLRKC